MKIFFSMTFRGDVEVGRKIYHAIETLGYHHTSPSFGTNTPDEYIKWGEKEKNTHFKRTLEELSKADIAIFESSIHSLTAGQLIQACVQRDVPVLILVKDKRTFEFLEYQTRENPKILIVEYTNDSLMTDLKSSLDYLTGLLPARFTMILPADLVRFLDKVSKETGKNRSDYIRDLLRKQIS